MDRSFGKFDNKRRSKRTKKRIGKNSVVSGLSTFSYDEGGTVTGVDDGQRRRKKPKARRSQDEKVYRKLNFPPLSSQFNAFARAGTMSQEITLNGIERWFQEAKIFSTPECKISVYDVRIMFQRLEKQSLNYSEMEIFILELGKLRKIHPDILTFRLQVSGNPELDARFFHAKIPEGIMDRLVDAFRMEGDEGSEEFVNLSKEKYQEPVCFGGIHRPFKAKFKEAEEAKLTAEAKKIMKPGRDPQEMDKLEQNFIYFAKEGNYYSDGRTMELTQLIRWMRQAGIVDGQNISTLDIGFLFKRLYSLNWRIFFDDLSQILHELSLWKNIPGKKLQQELRNCGDPASSSVSVITMSLKSSLLELLKKAVEEYSEELSEERDKYEPTTADTPYGHTANSRNRHFANYLQEDPIKVHSTVMSDMGKSKNLEKSDASGQKEAQVDQNGDEKEESFSEEKRNTKDLLAKRWDDAYPIGGLEVSNRPRTEPEFEKLMFGDDDAEVSDDLEKYFPKVYKGQERRKSKSGIDGKSKESLHPPVPLLEQFEKYKVYGDQRYDMCITSQQLGTWFQLAGVLGDSKSNSSEPKEEFESKMRDFKNSDTEESICLNFDELQLFIDFFAEREGQESKALRERLKRSGPPRTELNTIRKQSHLETKMSRRSSHQQRSSDYNPSKRRVTIEKTLQERSLDNQMEAKVKETAEIADNEQAQPVKEKEAENVEEISAEDEDGRMTVTSET